MERLAAIAGVFIILFVLERVMPEVSRKRVEKNHDIDNIKLGFVNFIFSRYFGLILVYAFARRVDGAGLLRYVGGANVILGVVIMDIVNYWWHRMAHRVWFLKKFHRIHHTDRLLNVSSALRFHFLEVLMGHLFKLPFILIFGVSLESLLIYDVIFSISVYFHHSNIKIPSKLDRVLSNIIITPYVHRIHHSLIKDEANSNFSSVVVFWDKLFNTYTPTKEEPTRDYGVVGYEDNRYQEFKCMIKQPFEKKS